MRSAKSRSLERGSALTPAGTAGLVLGARLIGKLGEVEGVHRDLGCYRLGLEGADPDRQVPVRFLLFENYQVLGCRHVDADAVHRHLDEVLHPRIHHTLWSSGLLLSQT